ncbi:MAG: septation protein SpoVG family protein [Planctomycetes bacterium]|nr:septation protein SpoVG family protein [Planctomycetota bacterium]
MNITDIKVKLMDDRSDKLAAFCSIILDDSFIIQDLKVIRGPQGTFVAMPSRKLTDKCSRCGGKNHLRARYCNDCGTRLSEDRAPIDANGRATLHADIAHPLNSAIREVVQRRVLAAYAAELENTELPELRYSGELAAASEPARRFGDGLI